MTSLESLSFWLRLVIHSHVLHLLPTPEPRPTPDGTCRGLEPGTPGTRTSFCLELIIPKSRGKTPDVFSTRIDWLSGPCRSLADMLIPRPPSASREAFRRRGETEEKRKRYDWLPWEAERCHGACGRPVKTG